MDFQRVIRATIIIVLFSSVRLSAQTVSDYFPMAVGNSWTYHERGIEHFKHTREIVDTVRVNSNLYYYYGSDIENAVLIQPDTLGRIWRYGNGERILWFDFAMAETDSFFYEQKYIVKARHNLTIETRLGVLDNCIFFAFDDPRSVDEELYYTFAPQIGLIEKGDGMGITYLLESATINGRILTNIEQDSESISSIVTCLKQNCPNPFNPITSIQYQLAKDCYVCLSVYNTQGQLVQTLVEGRQSRGHRSVRWDGMDQRGNYMASGVYFYVLKVDQQLFQTKKMALIR